MDSIQHLKINYHSVIKSQTLLNLGRVNILTGRNSSGKSTILKLILEKPDIGITYHKSTNTEAIIRGQIGDYTQPNRRDIDDWVNKIIAELEGKILFNSSELESHRIVSTAKANSLVRNYTLQGDIKRIARALVSFNLEGAKPLLLSPKRRMLYETEANAMQKLDSEASNALSRLFYLKNQMPDSDEKKIFDHIHKCFSEITGYEFDVKILETRHPPAIQLQYRRINGPWINAQDEGLGLSEVLSILIYSLDGYHLLLLIEEPENHLHPDLQRKLLSFFNSIENRQFILSTHSPIFLNPTMVDRIYFCKYINGEIIIDDNTSRAEALSQIGVLAIDNLTSDAIVVTEGKTDQIIINHIIMNWLNASKNASISHVFLAGSMMTHFDPTPFAQLRNTFVLLDLDTSNIAAQKVFIEACSKAGIMPTKLKRYCIENYYTLDSIRNTFGDIIPNEIKSLDVNIPPWKQLADVHHDENWWKGELKSARRIVRILSNMTIADIERTDLVDFCRKIAATL